MLKIPLPDPPRALGQVRSFLISILHLSGGIHDPALPGFLAGRTEDLKSTRMALCVSTVARKEFGNIKPVNINFSFPIIDSDLHLFSHHPEPIMHKDAQQRGQSGAVVQLMLHSASSAPQRWGYVF